jgi:PAS domain S-box-containing protein
MAAGELVLFALGAGQVELSTVEKHCGRWNTGEQRPLIALVDRRERALAHAAVAAGVTHVLLWPFEAADLDLELAVAERRAAERDRLFAVLRGLPDRIAFYDADGRLHYANHGVRGSADDLLDGERIEDIPAGVRERLMPAFRRARAGHLDLIEVESHGVHCRVRLIPFGSGGDRGVVLVSTDITRSRRMEEELRASVSKADALLDALPDMMFRVQADGVILDFQPEWAEKLAARADRMVGRRVADALPPALAAQTLEALALVLGTGRSQRFEFPLTTPSGTHDYEARLSAAGPEEAVAVVRDITEAKRLQAELALADRLASLGHLAAGVTHEINNPLSAVLLSIGFSYGKLRRLAPEQPFGPVRGLILERMAESLKGVKRVQGIVSELRLLAGFEEQEQEPVDVRRLIDKAASMVESQLRKRLDLAREYRQGMPSVLGRRDRLTQVFLNLLLHACQPAQDTSAPLGRVSVRADLDAAGRVVVEVEDSGPGLRRDELSRIFDPLFTSKPVVVGTGFGLWVCHTIVTSLGGELTARSRLGEGTVFRVVLPPGPPLPERDEEDRLALDERDEDFAQLQLGRLFLEDEIQAEAADEARGGEDLAQLELGRVLIIDDDAQVADSMAILLEKNDVQVARSGREGLARILSGGDFDWIFCDLMMRDLSGMDVYEGVRLVRPGMEQRFVFMTGGAFTPRAQAFLDQVNCPHLTKPFGTHQVVAAVRRRRLSTNRP